MSIKTIEDRKEEIIAAIYSKNPKDYNQLIATLEADLDELQDHVWALSKALNEIYNTLDKRG